MVPNQGKLLASRVHGCTKTGCSGKGVYATLTEQMYREVGGDRALRKESNAHWRRGMWRVVRVAMKHRLGQWWHRGKAYHRKAVYRPRKVMDLQQMRCARCVGKHRTPVGTCCYTAHTGS